MQTSIISYWHCNTCNVDMQIIAEVRVHSFFCSECKLELKPIKRDEIGHEYLEIVVAAIDLMPSKGNA